LTQFGSMNIICLGVDNLNIKNLENYDND